MKGYRGIILIAVLLLAVLYITRSRSDHTDETKSAEADIVLSSKDITLTEVRTSLSPFEFEKTPPGKVFATDVANPFTISFFKGLQKRFNADSLEEHLAKVREYLYSEMTPERAEALLKLYRKFLSYEEEMSKKLAKWGNPRDVSGALEVLGKIQRFQREFFGEEVADLLFGASVKSREYPLRRMAIINDDSLYAEEKRKRLDELSTTMWGEDAAEAGVASKPYVRYREELEIHERDFREMDAGERRAAEKEIRSTIFPSDVVERLDEVDRTLAEEKEELQRYKEEEKRILNDPNLTPEEKDSAVRKLQDDTLGDDAEAYRRREAIRDAQEEYLSR